MGGQNHQPCNQPDTSYLRFSTLMSRELSTARASVELANVALENVLLQELGVTTTSIVEDILGHLQESRAALSQMQMAISSLRVDMEEHQFEDLPTLRTIDTDVLGAKFEGTGLVDRAAWNVVSEIMHQKGFYGVLDFFDTEVDRLRQLTTSLLSAVEAIQKPARDGELNLVLEYNRSGNFKVEFALLYTAWHRFQQLFLASSMLSTELWYRYCGVGSLCNSERHTQAA